MTAPLIADVRQESFLAGVLDAAMQPDTDFVFDKAIASVAVSEKSGIYHAVPRGQMTRSEAQYRAYGVPAPLTEFNLSRKRYNCDTIELAAPVYDDIMNQVPADMQPQMLAMVTQGLAQKIKLKMEMMWIAKFMAEGVWSGFAPDGVVQDFDVNDTSKNYSSGNLLDPKSNPEILLNFAQRVCKSRHGLTPKTLIMTEDVFAALKAHVVIKDDIKYTQNALILQNSEAAKGVIAQALGVDEILVMSAVAEQAAEGQASQTGYMGKNAMLLLYKTNAPSIMTTSAGYMFRYTGDPNAVGGDTGSLRSWREEPTRRRVYEAATSFDFNIVAPDCGVYFKNVLGPNA